MTNFDNPSNYEEIRAKTLGNTIIVDFCKAFDTIHGGKMKQIPLDYGLHSRSHNDAI